PGQQRILAYTTNGATFSTNQPLGQISFAVPAGDFNAGGRITVTNAVVARTNALAAAPISLVHGAVLIQPVFRGDDGVVSLYITVRSNQTYVVQATTDFVHWTSISTNLAVVDYVVATDYDAVGYPFRFYRAVPFTAAAGGTITGPQLQSGSVFVF